MVWMSHAISSPKFQDMNDSLVSSCCSDVEEFLSDLDRSVAASRDVFHLFDQHQRSVNGTEREEEWMAVQEKVSQDTRTPRYTFYTPVTNKQYHTTAEKPTSETSLEGLALACGGAVMKTLKHDMLRICKL